MALRRRPIRGVSTSAQADDAATCSAYAWIPSFNIHYMLGIDGISFPLVMLTTFLCVLAMGASWNINKHVKAYCILFLLLETGMLGVFMALDFFLFYVFWEVMLLPMYFLIGVWGGPRREYAAIKFFLYTLLGSVLMLIAMLMLYFNSDLRTLDARTAGGNRRAARRLPSTAASRRCGPVDAAHSGHARRDRSGAGPAHVQHPGPASRWASTRTCSTAELLWGKSLAVVGLPAAVHRLRHQGAERAAAHVVARRPRRGPHADLDDPGRHPAEDGWLRHHPHLLPDLSRRRATTWPGRLSLSAW